MSRPTVRDVARAAGVSLATVDRVLNERPGVRTATVTKVHQAISDLGYARDIAAANLARQRQYTFAFVVPEATNSFLRSLHQAIEDAVPVSRTERIDLQIHAAPAQDPHTAAATIAKLQDRRVDGIAVLAPESPQVRDALIRAREHGVETVSVIADLPTTGRRHFVGIDNIAAGRTAGRLMGRFLNRVSGRILAVSGSMMARDQVERRHGFDQVIGGDYPSLETLPSLEGRDDPAVVRDLVTTALGKAENVVGIYCFGGGVSGLLAAMAEAVLDRPVVTIAHELTPSARTALLGGQLDAVIAQDVSHVVRSAIRVLRAECDDRAIVASQERIRIEIVLRENLLQILPEPGASGGSNTGGIHEDHQGAGAVSRAVRR